MNADSAPAMPAPGSTQLDGTQEDDSLAALPAGDTSEVRNLWDRIRGGFKMGEMRSQLREKHERHFASQPEYVERIVERSRRYLFHIVEEVEKRGMPSEIALLPIVESAFNPTAYSRSRASGIWQFIPSTGKNYGLQQNWWHDERRDIHAATTAALDYLQMLFQRFNSWELALAAYNCGEGRIAGAIARNRRRGLPTDYQSLQLPRETRNYVPKLLAVSNIVRDPGRFGTSLAPIPDKPYFSVVSTDKHIDLKLAAAFAEISVEEFLALNPAYNRPVIAAVKERNILIPAETADIFLAKLGNPDQRLVSWRTQKLRRGERFDSLAYRFGLSSAALKQLNGIPSGKRIAGGGTILVPVGDASLASELFIDSAAIPEASVPAPRTRNASHRVRKGDSLSSIARKFGVTPVQLRGWNRLGQRRIVVGQRLIVRWSGTTSIGGAKSTWQPARKIAGSASSNKKEYLVKRGDTLSSIARRFDVGVDDLRRWNSLSPTRALSVGTRVVVAAIPRG